MAPVVVIPPNYDDLSHAQREQIVPICITAYDRHGEAIAPQWFSDGVAPVQKQLVRIAQYALGDPWCVSELAEVTVHRLWDRYGSAVGRCPARRVLKKAMWLGEELKIGDWRKRKYPNLYVGLDALEEKIREQVLADPNEYAELFEQQIMLNTVEERLQHEGRTEMRTVYQLVRRGYSWQEVADQVGAANAECVKRRFYRWVKKAAIA
jgi:hypothetical protein